MISVKVRKLALQEHHLARSWLESRGVRVLGIGAKSRGSNEVICVPYVNKEIVITPNMWAYDYRFSDDLEEVAMLFKLTFA